MTKKLVGWKPNWICGKHGRPHDTDCGYLGFLEPAPCEGCKGEKAIRVQGDTFMTCPLCYGSGYAQAFNGARIPKRDATPELSLQKKIENAYTKSHFMSTMKQQSDVLVGEITLLIQDEKMKWEKERDEECRESGHIILRGASAKKFKEIMDRPLTTLQRKRLKEAKGLFDYFVEKQLREDRL